MARLRLSMQAASSPRVEPGRLRKPVAASATDKDLPERTDLGGEGADHPLEPTDVGTHRRTSAQNRSPTGFLTVEHWPTLDDEHVWLFAVSGRLRFIDVQARNARPSAWF